MTGHFPRAAKIVDRSDDTATDHVVPDPIGKNPRSQLPGTAIEIREPVGEFQPSAVSARNPSRRVADDPEKPARNSFAMAIKLAGKSDRFVRRRLRIAGDHGTRGNFRRLRDWRRQRRLCNNSPLPSNCVISKRCAK